MTRKMSRNAENPYKQFQNFVLPHSKNMFCGLVSQNNFSDTVSACFHLPTCVTEFTVMGCRHAHRVFQWEGHDLEVGPLG